MLVSDAGAAADRGCAISSTANVEKKKEAEGLPNRVML